MRRTRKIVAIALVTAALCADQALAAAPSVVVPGATVAGRLVSRLSVRFRRSMPSARIIESRREVISDNVRIRPAPPVRLVGLVCRRLSPLELRLPPPLH